MMGQIMHADISYAEPVGNAHLLDVYVPATGDGPFPAVMFTAGPPSAATTPNAAPKGPARAPDR